MGKTVEERERVVVRFAGDSGDGMQLAGGRFTDATAVLGNDLATLPDFPAEIRAPGRHVAGVSAFQIHFASRDILTPGDTPNVLVAMNPAALKANLATLERGATIIVNEDAFTKRNLREGRLRGEPARGRLADRLPRPPRPDDHRSPARGRGHRGRRHARRRQRRRTSSRSACCPGCTAARPTSPSAGSRTKFASKPASREANLAAFRAGWSFGETTELIDVQYRVAPATDVAPGTYRNVNGTTATALGLIAASRRAAGCRCCSPATRSRRPPSCCTSSRATTALGVRTIQAEDEIAAAGMALGAAFGGALGVTATSGPGMDLKAETIGLAVMLELPMIDHRRPARRPVDRACRPRPSSPTCCWRCTAATASRRCRSSRPPRRATASRRRSRRRGSRSRYRTPVILLTDLFLRQLVRAVADPRRRRRCRRSTRASRTRRVGEASRSCPTRATTSGARPWAIAGHARARAPHRRPREAGRHRQHLLRRPPTTSA